MDRLLKLIFALFSVVVGFVAGFFAEEISFHDVKIALLIFFVALFMACSGDFFGLLVCKFDKIGLVVYFLSFLFFNIGIAVSVVTAMVKKISFESILLMFTSPLIYCLLFILSIGLSAFSWALVKDMAIKS